MNSISCLWDKRSQGEKHLSLSLTGPSIVSVRGEEIQFLNQCLAWVQNQLPSLSFPYTISMAWLYLKSFPCQSITWHRLLGSSLKEIPEGMPSRLKVCMGDTLGHGVHEFSRVFWWEGEGHFKWGESELQVSLHIGSVLLYHHQYILSFNSTN